MGRRPAPEAACKGGVSSAAQQKEWFADATRTLVDCARGKVPSGDSSSGKGPQLPGKPPGKGQVRDTDTVDDSSNKMHDKTNRARQEYGAIATRHCHCH